MKTRLFAGCVLFVTLAAGRLAAQGSAAQSVSYIDMCALHSRHQINVEHYLQYPVDSKEQFFYDSDVMEMNLTLGNPTVNRESNNIFLQVALTTKPFELDETDHPLNVSLVLDRSASMGENDRMEKMKVALKEFCKIFRPTDYLSIVVYDDAPMVLYPAQRVTDLPELYKAIDNIILGGNTNIMAGMLTGFREIEKNFGPQFTNRLILMTDGIPTIGISNPRDIIERSKAFNKKGIEVSTLALGPDVNFDLMSNLAIEGRGLSHFIGDCDSLQGDIGAALWRELESLQPVAKNLTLSIRCPKNVKIAEVYGFKVPKDATSAEISLSNLGEGQNKFVLARLEVVSPPKQSGIPLNVRVDYFSPLENKSRKQTGLIRSLYVRKSNKKLNLLSEDEVRHNYTVAYVAEELRRSLLMQAGKDYKGAADIVQRCINELSLEYDLPPTANFKQLYGLLQMQQQFLKGLVKHKK